jgi:ATP-binding cassette, subfamily B, bacterial PglK
MFDTYRKLYDILDSRERKLALLVFVLMFMVALFEAVGVASIMPFMAVLANPEVVESNRYLASIYDRLNFRSVDAFLFFLGIAFLVIIVGSLFLRAFSYWVQVRFSMKRNHAWSSRRVQMYLSRPYEWFLDQHSGTLGTTILAETNRAVEGALLPALQLVSQGLVAIFLMLLMVAVDPVLAISIAVVLGGSYFGIFLVVRRHLVRVGQDIQDSNRRRFKLTQEIFGGIKDVKVSGLEPDYVERFRVPSLIFARRQVSARIVSELPTYFMQALVFGGVMSVLLYFMAHRDGLQTVLPLFSVYALAGYRLMPALQAMYKHVANIKVNDPMLASLHHDLANTRQSDHSSPLVGGIPFLDEPLRLRERLELVSVSYAYPGSERNAVNDVSLVIPAFSTVALVGPTGSGKTTLVDVILGLLSPNGGEILVDGQEITETLRPIWRRDIGYVPQQIFLADDTISANIAFGIAPDKVDQASIESASRMANLHDFVVGELPEGYSTVVGERGVRLSGGQRQRIGIARALYRDPDLLILDEATSALDNLTERAVMDAVHNLSRKKTIILIAHRLSTVRQCDRIFYLEHGRILGEGTYEQLVEVNEKFRLLANQGA